MNFGLFTDDTFSNSYYDKDGTSYGNIIITNHICINHVFSRVLSLRHDEFTFYLIWLYNWIEWQNKDLHDYDLIDNL